MRFSLPEVYSWNSLFYGGNLVINYRIFYYNLRLLGSLSVVFKGSTVRSGEQIRLSKKTKVRSKVMLLNVIDGWISNLSITSTVIKPSTLSTAIRWLYHWLGKNFPLDTVYYVKSTKCISFKHKNNILTWLDLMCIETGIFLGWP